MITIDVSAMPYLTKDILIVLAYLLIGAAIKFIDQAFDIKVFSKKKATILAIPTSVLMGYLMVVDPPSASIFLAIALGVAVANKIDNIAFRIGIGLLIIIPIFFSNIINILWLPFGLLFLSAVADEYGNDWSDAYRKTKLKNQMKKIKVEENMRHEIANIFFAHRSVMKVMMLALIGANQLAPTYLIAFLMFDFGYSITEKISFQMKPFRLKNPQNGNNHKTPKKTKETTKDETITPEPEAFIHETPTT